MRHSGILCLCPVLLSCAAREAPPVVAPTEPAAGRASASEPTATGERCPHGCSVGETCIRTLRGGGSREEHCEIVPDDCASPEVASARADLAAAHHDHERQKELYRMRATSRVDVEAAEDAEGRAKADLARAENTSVARCNAACTSAVCGDARCVAAPGVIECVAR
jgi:hypothetical protein